MVLKSKSSSFSESMASKYSADRYNKREIIAAPKALTKNLGKSPFKVLSRRLVSKCPKQPVNLEIGSSTNFDSKKNSCANPKSLMLRISLTKLSRSGSKSPKRTNSTDFFFSRDNFKRVNFSPRKLQRNLQLISEVGESQTTCESQVSEETGKENYLCHGKSHDTTIKNEEEVNESGADNERRTSKKMFFAGATNAKNNSMKHDESIKHFVEGNTPKSTTKQDILDNPSYERTVVPPTFVNINSITTSCSPLGTFDDVTLIRLKSSANKDVRVGEEKKDSTYLQEEIQRKCTKNIHRPPFEFITLAADGNNIVDYVSSYVASLRTEEEESTIDKRQTGETNEIEIVQCDPTSGWGEYFICCSQDSHLPQETNIPFRSSVEGDTTLFSDSNERSDEHIYWSKTERRLLPKELVTFDRETDSPLDVTSTLTSFLSSDDEPPRRS